MPSSWGAVCFLRRAGFRESSGDFGRSDAVIMGEDSVFSASGVASVIEDVAAVSFGFRGAARLFGGAFGAS